MKPLVIVGSGLAAYSLARALRKIDRALPIWLLTVDQGCFYSKPMLSNALSKGLSPQQLVTASAEKMAEDLDLVIREATRVTGIDAAGHFVLAGGRQIEYSKLVLAVGALPVTPPFPGANKVMTVNNLGDYSRFRAIIDQLHELVVIGPGLIGCEFANDLVSNGKKVTVIGPDRQPLGRLLPPRAAQALQAALAASGVTWHLGTVAEQLVRDGGGWRLQLSDGTSLSTEAVLSAIGLQPNTQLAQQAGLSCARGIVVDRLLQTSHVDIYALGDCAEVQGLVLPFVMPIMHGARALARTLTGQPTAVYYPAMPVVVKTPACPVVVSPPATRVQGEWHEAVLSRGVRSLFEDEQGRLLGFALTGEACQEWHVLAKTLPDVLPV